METGVTEREGLERERERERVLSCCLAENWTEEGEQQCGCPHMFIELQIMGNLHFTMCMGCVGAAEFSEVFNV